MDDVENILENRSNFLGAHKYHKSDPYISYISTKSVKSSSVGDNEGHHAVA